MIKIYTIKINDIKQLNDCRLTPNYFSLKSFFNKLMSSKLKVYTLKSLTKHINAGSYVPNYISNINGINYIRGSDIKKFVINESELRFINKSSKNIVKLKLNDIYCAKTQTSYFGFSGFALTTQRIVNSAISQNIIRIGVDTNIIDNFYLLVYLNSKFVKSQTSLASYGNVKIEFNKNQISQIQVLKLPTNDYNKVIQLTKELINLNEQAITLLNNVHNIVDLEFEKSLSKYNNINNQCYVSKNMLLENDLWTPKTYKQEYAVVRKCILDNYKYDVMSNIFDNIITGVEIRSKNYRTENEINSECIPFIRTSDIFNNEINMYPDYFFNIIDDQNIKTPKIEKDDIIFSKDGKISQCAIIGNNTNIIPCSGYFILKHSNKYDPNYLFAILTSTKIIKYQVLTKTVTASTIPHLKLKQFNNIYVPIFDNNIQEKIISDIKIYRNLIDLKNEKIIEIQSIFNDYYNKIIVCAK